MPENSEHTIWSNENLDINDWRDNLYDERLNLGEIVIPNGILLIGTLGCWDGQRTAAKVIKTGKISDCLSTREDGPASWFVDERGEFRARIHHHDGVNLYTYRGIKPGVSEQSLENMVRNLSKKSGKQALSRLTFRLGDLIGDVYGWTYPRRPNLESYRHKEVPKIRAMSVSAMVKKWEDFRFSTGIAPGKDYLDFQKDFKKVLSGIAEDAGFALYNFNKGHYECAAVLQQKDTGAYAYVSISDVRYWKNEWITHILYRRMTHAKDWSGGHNHYSSLENLAESLKLLYPNTKTA